MTSRERVLTTLQGGIPDRIGRMDYFWRDTLARWRTEGLGEQEDPALRFDFDFGGLNGVDLTLRFPVQVLEETEEYTIRRDENGVVRKDLKTTEGHTPHWMEFTLCHRADWERHRERLAWSEARLPEAAAETYRRHRERGLFVYFATGDPISCAYRALGQVNLFTQMMDDPDLVAEILAAYADLALVAARRLLEMGLDYDGAWLYGDLGYRNALLFSPRLYDRLLLPQHRRMCDFFNSRGKPVILHSCGRVQELIPRFIEAGFAAIQPLEAKAGQDVRELKQRHGKAITFFGNIDVRKMSGTREELREELLSKLEVARDGGYLFHSDHSVPPTVPWDHYCYLMELLDEYGRY